METLLTLSEQTRGGVSGSVTLRDHMHPGHTAPELALALEIGTDATGPNLSLQVAKMESSFALSENAVRALTAILIEWLRKIDQHRSRTLEDL